VSPHGYELGRDSKMFVALIGALVASGGAALWLVSRRDPAPKQPPPAARKKAGGRFSAVEIRPRGSACAAAHQLKGRRFLAKNAPTLPLRECAADRCACTFSKLRDRRTDTRRLEHGGLSAAMFLTKNRRDKRDRRNEDRSRQN
jgi:hypothetical protein